jgi:hypothetical protein
MEVLYNEMCYNRSFWEYDFRLDPTGRADRHNQESDRQFLWSPRGTRIGCKSLLQKQIIPSIFAFIKVMSMKLVLSNIIASQQNSRNGDSAFASSVSVAWRTRVVMSGGTSLNFSQSLFLHIHSLFYMAGSYRILNGANASKRSLYK